MRLPAHREASFSLFFLVFCARAGASSGQAAQIFLVCSYLLRLGCARRPPGGADSSDLLLFSAPGHILGYHLTAQILLTCSYFLRQG